MPDSSLVSARPRSSQYAHVAILFRCACFTTKACWVNHNLTCPHAQQGGTCPLGKPACLRHRGSSIVDQSAGDWSLVAAGRLSSGWVAGAAAEVSAVAESGAGDVKVDTGSAANTGNVSASGAWGAELQCASVLSEISSVAGPLGLLVFSGCGPGQPVVFSRCLMTRSWPRFRRFSTSPLVAALFQSVKS